MSGQMVAIAGFVSLFALMLLRVPVGMAMGLVGVTGFGYLTGFAPAMKLVSQTTMRTVTDYAFGVIPMFLLMGAFVSVSGISRELFRAANTFVGHWRGGLGIATIAACGGFAAISGSSVATAATFSAVAYPEMRRFKYPQSFATGVIAVGGTLGAMLPPSTVLAVYGVITQQDIGKLFIAGILPGLLAMVMHMVTILIIGYSRPGFLPAGPRSSWRERAKAIGDVWSPLLLFLFVIGGLYGGFFIPTEAGAVGAVGAFAIGVLRGKLSGAGVLQALLQATRTAAAVFTVLIGALCFGYFLTITQTPQHVTQFLSGLGRRLAIFDYGQTHLKKFLAPRVALLVHIRIRKNVVEENLRHFARHPDAPVRCGVPWQIAFVHADSPGDAHEKRHGGAFELCSWWLGILAGFNVFLHDVPARINIISVQSRGVILVFLNDLVAANRCVVSFPASRNLGFADEHVGLVKIGALFL